MKKYSFIKLSIYSLVLFPVMVSAQYDANGDALKTSCNCYDLTESINWQVGSVWNVNKIDLNQSFDYLFDVYFGNSEAGADGIVFGLQPLNTNIGVSGGGMGMEGVLPSLGIYMDTWQNVDYNDPADDHISINKNGDLNHISPNNLDGPFSLGNIEDDLWHDFRVIWDAPSQNLSVYFDGVLKAQYTGDIINSIFGGDPYVYWGFTSATGGENNKHSFCTKLEANISFDVNSKYCLGDEITLEDASESFGNILSWEWDIDSDGIIDYNTQNILHIYTEGGVKNITLKVIDESGCEAIETIQLTIEDPTLGIAEEIIETCSPYFIDFSENIIEEDTLIGFVNFYSDESLSLILDNPIELVDTATIYALKITENNCRDTVKFKVNVNPSPILLAKDTTECEGVTVDLSQLFIDNNEDTKNFFAPNFYSSLPFDNELPTEYELDSDISQIYVYKNTPWNCSDTAIININVIPIPFVNFDKDTIQLCGDQEYVTLNAEQPQVNYMWNTGSTSPSVDIILDGEYSVTTSNSCGIASDTVLIETCECYVYVANSFTPNDDGLNDNFVPIFDCLVIDYDFKIFNRWGDAIFQSNDSKQSWDGFYKGKKVPNGVYAYTLEINDMYKVGSVTVIE